MEKTEANGYMKQIVKYVKKNISNGYTSESLRWALINQGYSRTQANRAIEIANQEIAFEVPKFVEKPIIKIETEPPVKPKLTFWQRIKGWFG